MNDLVEQLRLEAKHAHSAASAKMLSAADRIEALEAEVERLQSEWQACGDLVVTCNRDGGQLIAEVGMEQAARLALRYVDDLRDLIARRIPDPDDLRLVVEYAEFPIAKPGLLVAARRLRATLPQEKDNDA